MLLCFLPLLVVVNLPAPDPAGAFLGNLLEFHNLQNNVAKVDENRSGCRLPPRVNAESGVGRKWRVLYLVPRNWGDGGGKVCMYNL